MHKDIFGYRRDYSVTEMLYELNLPNFDTVLHYNFNKYVFCMSEQYYHTFVVCYFLNVFLKNCITV